MREIYYQRVAQPPPWTFLWVLMRLTRLFLISLRSSMDCPLNQPEVASRMFNAWHQEQFQWWWYRLMRVMWHKHWPVLVLRTVRQRWVGESELFSLEWRGRAVASLDDRIYRSLLEKRTSSLCTTGGGLFVWYFEWVYFYIDTDQ